MRGPPLSPAPREQKIASTYLQVRENFLPKKHRERQRPDALPNEIRDAGEQGSIAAKA
jgi:hypothetical protein